MSDVLDAIFFGYAVGEIEWKKDGKEIVPVDVIGKPQEWFIFTRDNELRLRKFKEGQYFFEEGEKLPEYKFILTQNKPTYINPYGQKVLSKLLLAGAIKERRNRVLAVDDGKIRDALPDWEIPEFFYTGAEG